MNFTVKRNISVKMRDGIDLVGDLYTPEKKGRFPVIVFRTPYGRDDERFRKSARLFASNGFAFLNFDVRGRGDSDGIFRPYFNEGTDGYDLIEWAGKQSWSNGRIGTFGASYSARIQWLAALMRPPNLKAMISIVSPSDPFVESPTGVHDPMHISWRYIVSGRTLKSTDGIDWENVYKTLPLKDMPSKLGMDFEDWKEDLKHQTLDHYWNRICYQRRFSFIDLPVLHISGWYDDEQVGTFLNYEGMRHHSATAFSRENQGLIIGPWGHSVNSSISTDLIKFGSKEIIDLEGIEVDWFHKFLSSSGKRRGRIVKVFLMGENKWLDLDDWPYIRGKQRKFFLSSGGKANSRFGDGVLVRSIEEIKWGKDSYVYDPSNPTPFITEPTSSQIGGPDDYSSVERRDDVLVYTSGILENDIAVLGDVRANLYVKTNARDTDFMVMLLDVWPGGYAQRLCDGMVRGRYRNGMERIDFFEAGQIYKLEVDMWKTGHVFGKGHRIRVQISSSAFPKYSRNLNTGLDLATDSEMEVAKNEILHSAEFQSNLTVQTLD